MGQKTAFNYSIDLLAQRDYSRYKLEQKLKQRDFEQEEIKETLDRLEELNYLREEEYARMRIKVLAQRGESKGHILLKCQQEHLQIDQDRIDQVFQEYGILEHDQLNSLLEKKRTTLDKLRSAQGEGRQKQWNKALRYLISKGHSYHASKEALELKVQEMNQDSP